MPPSPEPAASAGGIASTHFLDREVVRRGIDAGGRVELDLQSCGGHLDRQAAAGDHEVLLLRLREAD